MTEPKQRERLLNETVKYSQIEVKSGGKWINHPLSKPSSRTWKGKQVTVSEGHRRDRDGTYRAGGPFYSAFVKPRIQSRSIKLESSGSEPVRYNGPITPPVPTSDYSGFAFPAYQDSHLDAVGADAIALVDPTDPNANLGVSLGEILREKVIPTPIITSWQPRAALAKNAASEYLNSVFGWLPLVDEIKSTGQSIRDANTMIENYRAASGTEVHREFQFPDIESRSEEIVDSSTRCRYSATTNLTALNSTPVPLTRSRYSRTRRWFSGSFTYFAHPSTSLTDCISVNSEIDKLYGLTLTPDVIWELTPWSWAIDWFTNAGSVINNVTAFAAAGLVMSYGYIMEETTIYDQYFMPATGLIGGGQAPRAEVISSRKLRKEAHPFGFGATWEGMTPTQIAITAALGITRALR